MLLRQKTDTYIPQTMDGIRYADWYENKLKEQHISYSRKADTNFIIISHDIMWVENPKDF